MAMANRKWDSGSPCLSPLWQVNSDVGLPLTRTEALLEAKIAWIHFLHLIGKLNEGDIPNATTLVCSRDSDKFVILIHMHIYPD